MSKQDTGTRLDKWLFKDNDRQAELRPESVVLSIVMEKEYMAPSLEWYLISEFKPRLNRHY